MAENPLVTAYNKEPERFDRLLDLVRKNETSAAAIANEFGASLDDVFGFFSDGIDYFSDDHVAKIRDHHVNRLDALHQAADVIDHSAQTGRFDLSDGQLLTGALFVSIGIAAIGTAATGGIGWFVAMPVAAALGTKLFGALRRVYSLVTDGADTGLVSLDEIRPLLHAFENAKTDADRAQIGAFIERALGAMTDTIEDDARQALDNIKQQYRRLDDEVRRRAQKIDRVFAVAARPFWTIKDGGAAHDMAVFEDYEALLLFDALRELDDKDRPGVQAIALELLFDGAGKPRQKMAPELAKFLYQRLGDYAPEHVQLELFRSMITRFTRAVSDDGTGISAAEAQALVQRAKEFTGPTAQEAKAVLESLRAELENPEAQKIFDSFLQATQQ